MLLPCRRISGATSTQTLGLTQPQTHLLQEEVTEDCLRDQALLTHTKPANQELVFSSFLGAEGRGWRPLKELAAESG